MATAISRTTSVSTNFQDINTIAKPTEQEVRDVLTRITGQRYAPNSRGFWGVRALGDIGNIPINEGWMLKQVRNGVGFTEFLLVERAPPSSVCASPLSTLPRAAQNKIIQQIQKATRGTVRLASRKPGAPLDLIAISHGYRPNPQSNFAGYTLHDITYSLGGLNNQEPWNFYELRPVC